MRHLTFIILGIVLVVSLLETATRDSVRTRPGSSSNGWNATRTLTGNNIHVMNADGSDDTPMTDNDWTQGMASWSHDGEKLAYLVTAIHGVRIYDIYLMNDGGSENQNIKPDYFPLDFLCGPPVFSLYDSKLYFVGEWWED